MAVVDFTYRVAGNEVVYISRIYVVLSTRLLAGNYCKCLCVRLLKQ